MIKEFECIRLYTLEFFNFSSVNGFMSELIIAVKVFKLTVASLKLLLCLDNCFLVVVK